jgi:zinc protease
MKNIIDINYEKFKLSNGLEVILYENAALPLAAVNIWYKAGSANDKKELTGMAHLFEHMMFQGSLNVPKEMHFKYIQEAGGTLNGSTNFDRTNYYEKLPANFLELALWLESDRMGFLIPTLTQEKLNNQIEVVKNERLERYDNQPYGLAWEIILKNLYPEGHPYRSPVIGYLENISSITLDDVKEFFQKYYAPSNASLVIAGNIKKEKTKELVEKYFAEIKSNTFTQLISPPPVQLDKNIIIHRKENVQLERIYFAWHTVKAFEKEDAALDILADILSGSKNSRLYKSIVFEKEIAQDVFASHFGGKYAGYFVIVSTAKPGKSLGEIKNEIFSELNKIQKEGVNEKELLKSKNGIKSSFIFSMQNIDSIANQLNYYNYFLNEPNYFQADLARYESVSSDLIRNILSNFLNKPYEELRISPDKVK